MLRHYPDPGIDSHFADSRRWWQALSAPELRVVICCDGVEVFMFQRQWRLGGKLNLLGQQHYRLPGNSQDTLPPEELWHTLREILAPLTGQYWHVVIVLSNQFSRWLVLPWQSEVRSSVEKMAYYSHGLRQAFGMEMQDWTVQAQVTAHGQNALINAAPSELIEKLESLFAEYRLTPGLIAPAWMLSVNQTMHMIRHQKLALDGWIISLESGSLTIGCMVKGEWQQIRQIPVDGNWRDTLHQYLLREQVMHPQFASLPVYMPQAHLSGLSSQSMKPFTVIDVQPSQWLGESFYQQFCRKLI